MSQNQVFEQRRIQQIEQKQQSNLKSQNQNLNPYQNQNKYHSSYFVDQNHSQQKANLHVDEQETHHISLRQFQTNRTNLINNSYENHNFQQYNQENKQQQISYQEQHSHLNTLTKIQRALTKIYYRSFHNRLITFYIQSLKQEQRQIRLTKQIQIKLLKEQNWPFKELFYKKFKTENDIIMLEFVNMCAAKIQATFKSYVTFKRHKEAMNRLNNFKSKLSAVVAGWKVWNIYNCKKIVELRALSRNIAKQIDSQIQNRSTDKVKKMKKLQYLKFNQQTANQNFRTYFNRYYEAGTWIYEVDKVFKFKNFSKKWGKVNYQPKFQPEHNIQSVKSQQNVQKKRTRQRQFRKPVQKQNKAQFINKNAEQQIIGTRNESSTNFSSSASNPSLMILQKPIMAKGKYVLDEQDIKNSQNEFLKMNQSPKHEVKDQNAPQNEGSQKKVNRLQQKNKLIKRQKYDPRKAIEQQKKRLKQQKIKQEQQKKLKGQNVQSQSFKSIQESNNASKVITQVSKKNLIKSTTNNRIKLNQQNIQKNSQTEEINDKTPPKKRNKTPVRRNNQRQQPKKQPDSPIQQNRQKTVQKVKKQSKLIKKDDNSKSLKVILNKKVQSKVNCWANKRDSQSHLKSQTNIADGQENSYKSKYIQLLKQKNHIRNSQKQQNQQFQQANNHQENVQANQRNSYQQNPPIKNKIFQINRVMPSQKEQQIHQQVYQSSFLKKLAQEGQKGRFSYAAQKSQNKKKLIITNQKNSFEQKQDKIQQKFIQLNNQIKNLSENRSSLSNLRKPQYQNEKSSRQNYIQPNPQPQIVKKKQEVYRPVQSLEDVYSSQYTDRLNNLKNKLNMLQSTRYIQRDESIPILLDDSKYVKKIYKDNMFSSLYWPQVRTMQTNFLDYIKFSLTPV